MEKFYKTIDGIHYMDVSEKAFAIFDCKLFDLYAIWEKDNEINRIPITKRGDIQVAFDYHQTICIEVPYNCSCHAERWAEADKIVHNGFIYVRYSDIKP